MHNKVEELQLLGEGYSTIGMTHKIKEKLSGYIMVRKIIKTTNREASIKFLHEVKTTIEIPQHMNIVRFYNASVLTPTRTYTGISIVIEYCEGGSLKTVGKRIRDYGTVISEKIVCRLAQGILQGLVYLDSKQIIHGNIKPSNILLTIDGEVKLGDFDPAGSREF